MFTVGPLSMHAICSNWTSSLPDRVISAVSFVLEFDENVDDVREIYIRHFEMTAML